MHKLLLTALAATHLLAAAPAQRPDRGGRGESRPAPKLDHFTSEEVTLPSKLVRRGEAGYTVYLPKGYADAANRDTKYPWLVWLHGFGGATRFGDSGGAEVIDRLLGEGRIPPLLVVVFRPAGRRSVYVNGEAAGDTEDLIVKDLVAHVQGRYRVLDGPQHRALAGESMGGMAALKIAMRHPGVFGVVAAHSAAILPADPTELSGPHARQASMMIRRSGLAEVFGDPIDKEKWAAEMPLGLVAAKRPEELEGLAIYFDAGTEDRYGFAAPNQKLHEALEQKGIPHVFRMVQGGGHAWGSASMKDNLLASMQFVGAAFAGKDSVPAAVEAASRKAPEARAGAEKAGAGGR
jgi:enterochelin esterase-like enzyme